MQQYDCVSYAVVARTDTFLDQDCGLKSMLCQYVHRDCRVIVDDKCGFLTLFFCADCTFRCKDSPAKSRKDPQKSKKTRLPPDSCLNNSVRAQTHAGPEKSVRSLSSSHVSGLQKFSPSPVSISVHKISRCKLPLPCSCPLLCLLLHGPFIVRSAQTRPPFTGFTQLPHPSRCSRSTSTNVCFCPARLVPARHHGCFLIL